MSIVQAPYNSIVTTENVRQFKEEGYFLLERAVPEDVLEGIRGECQKMINQFDAEMDRQGVDCIGINHRGKRYFISNEHYRSMPLARLLYSDLMAEIAHAVLGDNVYVFWEQFVVKCAEVGMSFSWHQDSGYIPFEHAPYITCWVPLDDVNEENGTVYILPKPRAGVDRRVEHRTEPDTNDLVGYTGDDPGIPVIVPAGSVAVFSSVTFHRSGPNRTDQMRRVFICQYAAEPVLDSEGHLWGPAEPLFRNGHRVRSIP